MLLIPLPFTVAALAVGRPSDATNVWGLVLLYCFTHAVRLLHYRLRVPIIPAIVAAALGYCVLGAAAARLLAHKEAAYLARRLTGIGCDLPIEVTVDELKPRAPDTARLEAFFDLHGFGNILRQQARRIAGARTTL